MGRFRESQRLLMLLIAVGAALSAWLLVRETPAREPKSEVAQEELVSETGVARFEAKQTMNGRLPVSELSQSKVTTGDVLASRPLGLGGLLAPSDLENLKTAIEASTYGRMDPQAVLKVANALLSEGRLADRAIPEVTDSGEVVIPFTDLPSGISANLSVGRSRAYGTVLSVGIMFDAPTEPYYLDGLLRNEASCTIRSYSDEGDNPLKLGIMTNLEPHYKRMQESGIPYEGGTIVEGVLYSFDAKDPGASKMKAYGWREGKPTDWEVPIVLDGGPWPDMEAVNQFSRQLLKRYSDIKTKSTKGVTR